MNILKFLNKDFYPTEPQKLVLWSLLLPESEAISSFLHWLEIVDFNALDHSSFRLVPSLFWRLAQGKSTLPHYVRMKGIYRYFYVRNNLLLTETHRTITLLQQAGIKVFGFKGLALALKYYSSVSLRPMNDVDILVPREQFALADEFIQQHGWRDRYPPAHRHIVTHSYDYINESGNGLDLHVRFLLEIKDGSFDQMLCARAETYVWQGLTLKLLTAQDLCLICLVNACRENEAMKFEWVCDLVQIIAHKPDLDWYALWNDACAYGLAKSVIKMLDLASTFPKLQHLQPIVDTLLDKSPEFVCDMLTEVVAEGRTFGISNQQRSEIELILDAANPQLPPGIAYMNAQRLPGHIRHIRLITNHQGAITGLYLQRQYLPYIATLFVVSDIEVLQTLIQDFPPLAEGILKIPPRLLTIPSHPKLPDAAYRASISIKQQPYTSYVAGTAGSVYLCVKNESEYCWPQHGETISRFGVSYHIYTADGTLVQWDGLRYYFIQPCENYLPFIEPGANLSCSLNFSIPELPGHYIFKLDLVQEMVCWFSNKDCRFPEFAIEVIR